MTPIQAIERAVFYAERRARLTKDQKALAVGELAGFGVFSNRQIAGILDMRLGSVGKVTGKTDRTGGRLPVDALPLVLDAARMRQAGEIDPAVLNRALDAGVSMLMLSRLAGIPKTTMLRWAGVYEGGRHD